MAADERGVDALGGWGPPWLRFVDERRAHRDAAAAILGRALRARGDRSDLARYLGTSRSAISRLISLVGTLMPPQRAVSDDTGLESPWRLSHVQTRELAVHLEIPRAERERLLFHAAMSKRRAFDAYAAAREVIESGTTETALVSVHQLYGDAEQTFVGGYQRTADAALALLTTIQPGRDLATFVLLLLVLHQCLCVLDRDSEAFYVARLATELADHGTRESGAEELVRYSAQSRCAQGVALSNIGLSRSALGAYENAEATASRLPSGSWAPMVARGRLLAAASRHPRRHTSKELVRWANQATVDAGTQDPERASVMTEEALARALAQTGRPLAVQQARTLIERLLRSPPTGALYSVHVLKTATIVAKAAGDRDAADHHHAAAKALAARAGLFRELHRLDPSTSASAARRRIS